MQRINLSAATCCCIFFAASLSILQTTAHAARPWSDPGEKPGNDNGNGNGKNGNKAPTIEGTPPTVAEVDGYYGFQASANDRDGDVLVFSIGNKPAWAAFDTARGFLSGYPTAGDANSVTSNITITVSDGAHTASLAPFSITVGDAANAPPVITGSPSGEAIAAEPYGFVPQAADPDGDTLRFSVSNRPVWANFDSSSGRFYGTPGDADVGVYENIRIGVTDGTASAYLNSFSVAVVQTTTGVITLSWLAPTENTDGTPVTGLAGYRVYYGTASGQYDHQREIAGAGTLSAVIDNLTQGTWYFAATAITSAGIESGMSNEIQKAVQ